MLVQTEVERVKFVVRSYIRTRLYKGATPRVSMHNIDRSPVLLADIFPQRDNNANAKGTNRAHSLRGGRAALGNGQRRARLTAQKPHRHLQYTTKKGLKSRRTTIHRTSHTFQNIRKETTTALARQTRGQYHRYSPVSSSKSQFSSPRFGGAMSCIGSSLSPSAIAVEPPPSDSRTSTFFFRLRFFAGAVAAPSSSPSSTQQSRPSFPYAWTT
jgi:hypothetical protein